MDAHAPSLRRILCGALDQSPETPVLRWVVRAKLSEGKGDLGSPVWERRAILPAQPGQMLFPCCPCARALSVPSYSITASHRFAYETLISPFQQRTKQDIHWGEPGPQDNWILFWWLLTSFSHGVWLWVIFSLAVSEIHTKPCPFWPPKPLPYHGNLTIYTVCLTESQSQPLHSPNLQRLRIGFIRPHAQISWRQELEDGSPPPFFSPCFSCCLWRLWLAKNMLW